MLLGFVSFTLHILRGKLPIWQIWSKILILGSELPSNLVLKKVSPKIWLPFLTAIWGILTMCLGFVTNFASFVTVRALLGVAEGGLLPGMVRFWRRDKSSFANALLGAISLSLLSPPGARSTHRHLLHCSLPLRCFWRTPRSRPQCHWPSRWTRRLEMDSDNRGLDNRCRRRMLRYLPSQLHRISRFPYSLRKSSCPLPTR